MCEEYVYSDYDMRSSALTFCNNSLFYSIDYNDFFPIYQLNLITKKITNTLIGHVNTVVHLVSSVDENFLYSGSRDTTIIEWETKNGNILRVFNGYENIYKIIVSNDLSYLFVLDNDDIKIRNMKNNTVETIKRGNSDITGMTYCDYNKSLYMFAPNLQKYSFKTKKKIDITNIPTLYSSIIRTNKYLIINYANFTRANNVINIFSQDNINEKLMEICIDNRCKINLLYATDTSILYSLSDKIFHIVFDVEKNIYYKHLEFQTRLITRNIAIKIINDFFYYADDNIIRKWSKYTTLERLIKYYLLAENRIRYRTKTKKTSFERFVNNKIYEHNTWKLIVGYL